MLSIESPMLCARYTDMKKEQQEEIWTSDQWIVEEKFDGCRMPIIFVRGEGIHFYSRNISVEDFLPIHYDNIWHSTDVDALGKMFDSFVMDAEVMCRNPNICRLLEDRGVPTETILQAVASLLSLNREESVAIQKAGSSLYFKSFDVLMVNGDWGVLDMPLSQRRRGLRVLVDSARSCGLSVTMTEHIRGEESKRQELENILEAGGEGIVAKRLYSPYIPTESRRKDGWVKIKRSMKNSLRASGLGDTVDGWISGFQRGEVGKQWENHVGTVFFSVNVRDSKGNVRTHEIARVSNFSDTLRNDMTEIGPDGEPRLKDTYYGRVVELDGQCISARNRRLKHATIVRFREDKYPDLCVMEEDFLNAMIL